MRGGSKAQGARVSFGKVVGVAVHVSNGFSDVVIIIADGNLWGMATFAAGARAIGRLKKLRSLWIGSQESAQVSRNQMSCNETDLGAKDG